MKKILIIHTGGTFGMVPERPKPTLRPSEVEQNIITHVPELAQLAEIEFQVAFNLDSADMAPANWQKLARMIYEDRDRHDGFVIIHGTDSMAYSATALSFMLPNLNKPVILTGSQRPLGEIRTDARMNLVNAVEFATREIPEVCIFFGTRLLRGNRTVKISSTEYGAFTSPNFPPLAEVGVDVHIRGNQLPLRGEPGLLPDVSDQVLALPFFPGLDPAYVACLATTPVRAIVIEALGMGNVAIRQKSLVPMVEALSEAGKLVVITTQCRRGTVDLNRYQNGMMMEKAGAIGARDMTTETTVVKLMHLLGNYGDNMSKVREMLTVPLAGEISDQLSVVSDQ